MKISVKDGITINCIQSTKFKDIAVVINFLGALSDEAATKRSLLAMMLSDRCEKYDTKQKVSNICDKLYGATFSCRTLGCGGGHIIEVRSKIINPMYVEANANLYHDQLGFIYEMLFHPLRTNGHFDQDVFAEAKHILESKIQRRIDDAQSFSIMRAFQIAGANQYLGISTSGSEELLAGITIEDIELEYTKMLNENQIEIIICGEFEESHMIKAIEGALPFMPRSVQIQTSYKFSGEPVSECVVESKEIPQTNIAIVYQTNLEVTDPRYSALKVANGIFGQYPSSFLFQEVREKNSLCYSIFSNLISFDGAMLVSTGVEHENIDQTVKLIREQFKKCQAGEFDEELIEVTKKMLINGLKASLDDMNSMVAYSYNNSILNREQSVEDSVALIEKVNKEAILEVFQQCQEIVTFVLTNKENV